MLFARTGRRFDRKTDQLNASFSDVPSALHAIPRTASGRRTGHQCGGAAPGDEGQGFELENVFDPRQHAAKSGLRHLGIPKAQAGFPVFFASDAATGRPTGSGSGYAPWSRTVCRHQFHFRTGSATAAKAAGLSCSWHVRALHSPAVAVEKAAGAMAI